MLLFENLLTLAYIVENRKTQVNAGASNAWFFGGW